MNYSSRYHYNEQKDSWYSPLEILIRFEQLRNNYGEVLDSDPLFKKAREMFIGAIALGGAYELSDQNIYYMQLNTQTDSPDVVAVRLVEKLNEPVNAEIVQMEIVEFEKHSKTQDIVKFLRKNKLPPRKYYDAETMIICLINKKLAINPKDISDNLKQISPPIEQHIYIIGRDAFNTDIFYIFSPYPKVTKIVPFEIVDTLNKHISYPRIRLFKGTNSKIEFTEANEEMLSTAEILGLDKDKIHTKYPKSIQK